MREARVIYVRGGCDVAGIIRVRFCNGSDAKDLSRGRMESKVWMAPRSLGTGLVRIFGGGAGKRGGCNDAIDAMELRNRSCNGTDCRRSPLGNLGNLGGIMGFLGADKRCWLGLSAPSHLQLDILGW